MDPYVKSILGRLFMGPMNPPQPAMFSQGLMDNPMPPQYRTAAMLSSVGAGPVAMNAPGNIDIFNRPQVPNEDGSISTVRSMSFQDDAGNEVLIPTVSPDGRIMSDREAIALYRRTGKHLGKFPNWRAADRFAEALHNQQDRFYSPFKRKP